ncbi:MAG: hypothetical protein IPM24_11510 [Bryobacterales bacterium]|nr:hypothetical protein [Bryobacterales bacterium]
MAANLRPGLQNSRVACATSIMLVFVLGAILGAGSMTAVNRFRQKSPPFWTEGGKALSVQKWKRDLNLTPDQTREIEAILDDFTMYYRNVVSDGKTRIMTILNEEQRQKFRRMMEESQPATAAAK